MIIVRKMVEVLLLQWYFTRRILKKVILMSFPDFTDPAIDRKLSFQIAQKGCGLHRDRFLCVFDMGSSEVLVAESAKLILELAQVHYEADFCVVTTAKENRVERGVSDDNLYLVDSLTDEQVEYVKYKSRIVITENDLDLTGIESVRASVVDALKREKFKRDETTKVSYFKINTSQSVKK